MEKMKNNKPDISLKDFKSKDLGFLKMITLASQLGLLMIANILIWFFGLRWLITMLKIDINFQFAGIVIGILAGSYSCYRILFKYINSIGDNE